MKILFLSALLVALSAQLHAYELGTHARLTWQAYLQSALTTDAGLLRDLGVDEPDAANPFGKSYFDVSGGRIEERQGSVFAVQDDRMPEAVAPYSMQGWLIRGAIREDDYLRIIGAENPPDDPYGPLNRPLHHFYDPRFATGFPTAGPLNRPLHHFYDPFNNKGLSVFPIFGARATDWAIGSENSFSDPPVPDTSRRNHFTLFDAREALHRALTGKDRNGQIVAAGKTERNKYWATVFRALGDIVHLIQDMAQPQHTRNDPHSGNKYDGFAPFTGHKSLYESYVEARAKQEDFITKQSETSGGELLSIGTKKLRYTGYPTPTFDDYVSYFSTRHIEGADTLLRRGLADYSNRGFLSAGTNFGNTGDYLYPDPDPGSTAYIRSFITTDWNGDPLPNGGAVEIVRGTVPDALTGQQDQAALSTFGLWDQFLARQGDNAEYTLTRANYDDMADLLIPRAVAYSAGIINRFFRGRIEILINDYSGQSVTLKFVNRSARDTFYDLEGVSELSVVYTYSDSGNEVFGTSEAAISLEPGDNVSPGSASTHSYAFTFSPAIPDDAQDLRLQLVFRGKLGSEQDAIAVGLIEMSAPGFIFNPSNTPSDGLEGTRYIYKGNGQWTLGDIQGLVSGNTDWKGWYVNGKPTKAVSWQGPKSRYFPDGAPFTPNIYYNGELYSVAPYPVLGAALNQDASGNTWIVAICQNGSNDVVLKRPLTRNTSTELYDPQFHPEGWRMLEEFTPLSGFLPPDRPWFFNGTGTQAQTLRKSNTPLTGGLERMKITILQDSATIDHLGNLPGKSSYGNVGGNGCISQQNTDWNCSGSIANPTGRFVTDIVRENRYGRDYGARGSYIVAVDYLDDRETLAILSLEDSFDETIFWGEDSHNTGTCYLENTANRIYSTTQNRKNKALYAQVQKQVLSLSSDKLGMLVINQLDFTRSSNWPNSTWKCPELEITPFDYTQCQSEDHQAHTIDKKETIRRIDFMDLRNGTALVSESATDNLFSSHIDAYNQSWTDATEVVTTDSTTKTSRYQLMLGDEPITLYAYNETTPGAQISTLPTPPGGWNINTLCRQESSSGESDTYTSMTTTVSIPLNPPTVSMASDSSGNIFASIQIIDEDNNPRVFNFLTNADPDQVIGITETGTTYYPIGLK